MFINKFLTCNVHVTDVGHVYVFGKESNSQVNTDGKTILKTHNMGVSNPASVLLIMRASRFHVGAWNNDNIVVFKANVLCP
ncbi:hypothetical protein DPMN_154048 [Dreissena polymorpha]|uniref:Uncharacterized protein n=1 Tax=Dreissena polymorpha TaxID=45954 RepID=A0A9D4FQ10_DREPO|nr:hypothetical protein DPMN_154048 [Dreissena polymorpha]